MHGLYELRVEEIACFFFAHQNVICTGEELITTLGGMALHRHVQLRSRNRALLRDPILHLLLVTVVIRKLVREDG